jgi:hypothetical protein
MSDAGQAQGANVSAQTQSGFTQADLVHHSQELGLLGYIFGCKEHAPFYIAAMAIVLAFVMIACVLFFAPQNAEFPRSEAVTLFGAIITGALGYIFGRSNA